MSVSALKELCRNTSVILKGRLQFKESFTVSSASMIIEIPPLRDD